MKDNIDSRVVDKPTSKSGPRLHSLFYDLMDSDHKSNTQTPHTRRAASVNEMAEQAFTICVAASDTTGNALTVATYHAIQNPMIFKALASELREAFPNRNRPLSYVELEKLPYLTGVIKEAQR